MGRLNKGVIDMNTEWLIVLCRCGHKKNEHDDGGYGCLAKVDKGNNRDFCECEEFKGEGLTKGIRHD